MDVAQFHQAGSLFASIFVIATTTMRTMIPLRVFGIITNIILIVTSLISHTYPTLVLHAILLPLNAYRLHQMLQLVREVKKSVNGDLSMDWLKPFMTERQCQTGEVLFYKNEKAEHLYYIVSGRYRLVESGIEIPTGILVGELGMLSPANERTQTLECIEGGMVLSCSYRRSRSYMCKIPSSGSTSCGSPAPGCSRTSSCWSSGWPSRAPARRRRRARLRNGGAPWPASSRQCAPH